MKHVSLGDLSSMETQWLLAVSASLLVEYDMQIEILLLQNHIEILKIKDSLGLYMVATWGIQPYDLPESVNGAGSTAGSKHSDSA